MLSAPPQTVQTPPPPSADATQQDKDAAERALISCLFNAAKQNDDQTSDVMSVAVGIKSMCHSQFVRYVATYTRGMDPETRQMTEDKVAPEELGLAASAVLRNRVIGPGHEPAGHDDAL
jgi:hypothetical protein